jgi:hypothetical protein
MALKFLKQLTKDALMPVFQERLTVGGRECWGHPLPDGKWAVFSDDPPMPGEGMTVGGERFVIVEVLSVCGSNRCELTVRKLE